MKPIAISLILVLMVWAGVAAQTGANASKAKTGKAASKQPATTTKKTASKSTSTTQKKTVAGTTTKKGNVPTKSAGARKTTKPVATRSYAQNEPTPDRYREIQQALIERGYLKGDPSGRMDPETSDALRRFQGDQNLEANGKLDSLSLIALGLGPRRTASAQARP